MASERKIEIWEPQSALERKAALPSLGKARFQVSQVDVSVVSGNLKQLLSDFQAVLDELPASSSGYYVDEIELSLGVSGSGSIALIGKLEAGIEAGIKVRLKRATRT